MALALKVPPLVVVLITAVLMWLAAQAAPAACVTLPARPLIAAAFAIAGLLVSASGVVAFRRAKTTVDPTSPHAASALVRTGIYAYTRNPMYLGLLLLLVAWSVRLSSLLAFALLPAFVLYIDRFQIAPEEWALASRFGPEFADYRSRVRRWL
jgi:protein-S-isoprenylcysteine O-methyltransferase Ste14